MIYEMKFEKEAQVQTINKKRVIVWVPKYTSDQLDQLGAALQAGLAGKFVAFGHEDQPTAQAIAVEYTDQPTPEETAAVNLQIDDIIAAWVQENA